MHVVVCTVVHHPADARIFYREIQALLDAGHDVTYIAPHGEAVIPGGTTPRHRRADPRSPFGMKAKVKALRRLRTGAGYPPPRHHSPRVRQAPGGRAARRAGGHGRGRWRARTCCWCTTRSSSWSSRRRASARPPSGTSTRTPRRP